MKLNHGLHLAYCTNIHRGESWPEIFDALQRYTLKVKERVCYDEPYAIGLRLSARAAQELNDGNALLEFQHWLEREQCYVFTINGFPYGQFHGTRVKEQAYLPDWTSPERLAYTNLLFDLLAQIVPAGVEGSVSTVPCGFKELLTTSEQFSECCKNLWRCVEHIAKASERTGRKLHLGLEPEPLCVLEKTDEVLDFFARMNAEHPNDPRLAEHLGVNYDTCHLAVEFEEPREAISALIRNGIRLSKIHLSSALKLQPTSEVRRVLESFSDDVYFHQTIVRTAEGKRLAFRDLPDALRDSPTPSPHSEWRVHFHIPLHSPPTRLFDTTSDHLLGVLDLLKENPRMSSHLEMETYTWEVLPPELKNRDVVEQLSAEYEWTLARLAERGLARKQR